MKPPFRGDDPAGDVERSTSFDAAARADEAPESLPTSPECPFCDGHETEIMSAFGSQLSVSTYWCRDCRSPFEHMKWG